MNGALKVSGMVSLGVGRGKSGENEVFYIRLLWDTGFHLFYKNLYDSMRLSYLRMFDHPPPKVARIEYELIEAVRRTLVEEKSGLQRSEAYCMIQRRRVWRN